MSTALSERPPPPSMLLEPLASLFPLSLLSPSAPLPSPASQFLLLRPASLPARVPTATSLLLASLSLLSLLLLRLIPLDARVMSATSPLPASPLSARVLAALEPPLPSLWFPPSPPRLPSRSLPLLVALVSPSLPLPLVWFSFCKFCQNLGFCFRG